MTQCPLWKVVIIDVDVALQGLCQVLPGAKAVGRQDLADAAVKALNHTVGLGMARRDEAVLDGLCVTVPIAAMLIRRFPLTGRAEPVGEFLAVIGQDVGDLNGRGLEEIGQEALGAGGGLLRQDLNIDPARGAVDGAEQVATLVLVGHVRQVLNVDMDKAGGVVLEGLIGRLAAFFGGRSALRPETPWRRRQRSRPERETPALRNSRVTASKSSRGSGQDWRRATTTASWAGERVVCRRCGRWERSVVSSRRRHLRTLALVR